MIRHRRFILLASLAGASLGWGGGMAWPLEFRSGERESYFVNRPVTMAVQRGMPSGTAAGCTTISYTLAEAATACGINKSTVLRAVKAGRISGTKDEFGTWHVEAAELHRYFYLLQLPQQAPRHCLAMHPLMPRLMPWLPSCGLSLLT